MLVLILVFVLVIVVVLVLVLLLVPAKSGYKGVRNTNSRVNHEN
ncbi:hypothetical protein N9L19_01425 [bacterium]|nr:hypothetical protein [bacterium]